MKHLKTFESMKELHLSDEEIDDIKDVFQDLIDEYDIQKVTPQTPVGKNTTISFNYRKDFLNVRILLVYSMGLPPSEREQFAIFTNDVNLICDRLKSMGYTVNINVNLIGYILLTVQKLDNE